MALIKAHAFAHEAVKIGGVHPTRTKRVDGIIALLVGHDENDVGLRHEYSTSLLWVIDSVAKETAFERGPHV